MSISFQYGNRLNVNQIISLHSIAGELYINTGMFKNHKYKKCTLFNAFAVLHCKKQLFIINKRHNLSCRLAKCSPSDFFPFIAETSS